MKLPTSLSSCLAPGHLVLTALALTYPLLLPWSVYSLSFFPYILTCICPFFGASHQPVLFYSCWAYSCIHSISLDVPISASLVSVFPCILSFFFSTFTSFLRRLVLLLPLYKQSRSSPVLASILSSRLASLFFGLDSVPKHPRFSCVLSVMSRFSLSLFNSSLLAFVSLILFCLLAVESSCL